MLQIVEKLTDDYRGIIYDRNIFKIQATGFNLEKPGLALLLFKPQSIFKGATTFSIKALSIKLLTITILSIMKLSITTFFITTL